jgi:hypothetical protein
MHIKETLKTIKNNSWFESAPCPRRLRQPSRTHIRSWGPQAQWRTKMFVRLGNSPTGISATIFKSLRIPEQEEQGQLLQLTRET